VYFAIVVLLSTNLWATPALSRGVSGAGTGQSAFTLPSRQLEVGFGASYYQGSAMGLQTSAGSDYSDNQAEKASRMDWKFGAAYGLLPFLEMGIYLPLYRDTDVSGESFTGIGDLRTSAKFNYPPRDHKEGFKLSLLAQMDFPTAGEQDQGYARNAWYMPAGSEEADATKPVDSPWGSPSPVAITKMMTTANFGAIEGMFPLMLHLNWGMAFSETRYQNAFLLGGGLDLTPHEAITLFWSYDVQLPLSGASKSIPLFDYPIASAAGIQFNIPRFYLQISAGAHFVVNEMPNVKYRSGGPSGTDLADRVPKLGFFGGVSTSFSLAPGDDDGDGVLNSKDRCINQPEDMDGYQDEDGCPDLDNDKDGIPDKDDKCPDKKEDIDGFEDEDGCPEEDNDGDKIMDSDDRCPMDAEDLDGFEDADGCPDLDNDKDGVADAQDKCVDLPEDVDGFEDDDGCPDPDNDKDGIPDRLDKCPNVAEVVNGVDDSDGCPDKRPGEE